MVCCDMLTCGVMTCAVDVRRALKKHDDVIPGVIALLQPEGWYSVDMLSVMLPLDERPHHVF